MPRKPRKTPPRPRPKDRADLITVLMEQTAPSTPEAWFEAPWKNGHNAIHLAIALAGETTDRQHEVADFLSFEYQRLSPGSAYWHASRLREVALAEAGVSDASAMALARAAEMFLKWISNSDGGGLIYNHHLREICEYSLSRGETLEWLDGEVLLWRRRDALGCPPNTTMPQDAQTMRRLRAFETAWKAGLFRVAFCV